MLETNFKSIQQFSMLAKVLGIVLLFVLTSCPLKASIKQSLNPDSHIELKNNKIHRIDASVDQFAEFCSSAIELNNGTQAVSAEFQFQPLLLSFGFVFLLALFIPQQESIFVNWNTAKLKSNPSLIQIRRLNL